VDKRCGSYAGAKVHLRKKEPPCEPCRIARNEYNKSIYEKYPERKRSSELKTVYNITLEQYNQMLEDQNGVCYICEKPEEKLFWKTGVVMRLAVDHDHACCPEGGSCGKCVRGLLCHLCNDIIGKIERNNSLDRIIAYIKKSASPRL